MLISGIRYKTMKSCWEANPDDRLTFSDLVYQLNSVLNMRNAPGYVDMYQRSRIKGDDDSGG